MASTFTCPARRTATALAWCAWLAALTALSSCGGDNAGGTGNGPGGGGGRAPSVTLTAPANLASNLTGLLAVSAAASDNTGVASIEIQVDGQAVGSAGSGASHNVTVDTTAYASGQHIVRARSRNTTGGVSDWATATVSFGGARTQPAGFTRSELVTGLGDATAFAQAPDGRYFVATQTGALRIVTSAGSLLATPFITLSVDARGERGLIGVALHPGFAGNGLVYVYYTTPEGGTHNRISRYTANPLNPNIASVGSEVRIADLPALSGATNHNGGALHFGLADGKLYVGVGDNAVCARAPDLSQVFGKVLRFNDDGSIPGDNPVCTTPGSQLCAVWARGLRNPFTLAEQAGTGRLHINDVGEGSWEEIDLGAPAANYGWPASEGPTSSAGIAAPLFAYPHSAVDPAGPGGFFSGCAVIGGEFYPTGGNFPAAYRGNYYFGDLCSGFVAQLDLANNNAAYAFGQVEGSPVGLLVGLDGALNVLTRTAIVRFSAAP
jgi:glucose/arabinose dehydrogenase